MKKFIPYALLLAVGTGVSGTAHAGVVEYLKSFFKKKYVYVEPKRTKFVKVRASKRDLNFDLDEKAVFTIFTKTKPINDRVDFEIRGFFPTSESEVELEQVGQLLMFTTPPLTTPGQFQVKVFVAGKLAQTEDLAFTVDGAIPPTTFSGRLLDANDASQGTETPVVGGVVSFLDTGVTAVSDSQGNFTLTGLTPGQLVFDIATDSAQPGPGGETYSAFREALTVNPGANVIDRPFFLTRVDQSSATPVDPVATTVVTNSNIDVTITIPPNTAKNPDGTDFTGEITLSEVPRGFAPASLPDIIDPGMLITIQPVGITFAQPVPLEMSNMDQLPEGAETDIWSLDAESGTFDIVGTGRIQGGMAVTETGGVRSASWHAILPPGPQADFTPRAPRNNTVNISSQRCTVCEIGSEARVDSGSLRVFHGLASYRSVGVERKLTLNYNSETAAPKPVLFTGAVNSVRASVPGTVSAQLMVEGTPESDPVFTDSSGFDDNQDEAYRQTCQVDATTLTTGSHPFELFVKSNFQESSVAFKVADRMLVNNLGASSFGAGWDLDTLQRITLEENGDAIVTDGTGTILRFTRRPVGGQGFKMEMFDLNTTNPNDLLGFVQSGFSGEDPDPFGVATKDINTSLLNFTIPTLNFGNNLDNNLTNFGPNERVDPGTVGGIAKGDDTIILPPQVHGGNTFEFNGMKITGFLFLPEGGTVDFSAQFDEGGTDDAIHLVVNNRVVVSAQGVTRPQGTLRNLPAGFVPFELNYAQGTGSLGFSLFVEGGGLEPGIVRPTESFPSDPGPDPVFDFQSPPGEFSALASDGTGGVTRTLRTGTVFSFDSAGRMVSEQDRNNLVTSYEYDAEGKLIRIVDPVGIETTFAYGTDGKLDSITHPGSRVTSFIHNAAGDLIKITDPDGSERNFTYDSTTRRMLTQTSKNGHLTEYKLDFAGKAVGAIRPDLSEVDNQNSHTVGLVDPASGIGTETNPAAVVRPEEVKAVFTDARGNSTEFEQDLFGLATQRTDALGNVLEIDRDREGLTEKTVQDVTFDFPGSPIPVENERFYDDFGNVKKEINVVNNATRTFQYGDFDLVTEIEGPRMGQVVRFEYDTNGNQTKSIDAKNAETVRTFNSFGQILTETNPEGETTQFEYDPQGRLTKTIDPLLKETIFTHDPQGNVKTIIDANAHVTEFIYDEMNRVVERKDPDQGIVTFGYDGEGNLTTVMDQNNNITRFEYDTLNRLTKSIDPNLKEKVFSYDPNGNLTEIINRNGETITFTYDELNRLSQKTFPDGTGFLFQDYNELGNPRQLSVVNLGTMEILHSYVIEYDLAFQLPIFVGENFHLSGPLGRKHMFLRSTYDLAANRSLLRREIELEGLIVDTEDVLFDWDLNNDLERVSSASIGEVATFVRDTARRITSRQIAAPAPGPLNVSISYDGNGRITDITNLVGASTISQLGYVYDDVGNRTNVTPNRPGLAAVLNTPLSYVYDELDQVISATAPLSGDATETFTYDPAGNRIRRNGQTVDSLIGTGNRLQEDADFQYSYDDEGNLIERQEKAPGTEVQRYAWDAENRLKKVEIFPNPSAPTPDRTVDYLYDVFGKRVRINDSAGRNLRLVWDGDNLVAELDENDDENLAAFYYHGDEIDVPLMMVRSGQFFGYARDSLGSILELVDVVTGNVVQSYVYDSFGRMKVFDATGTEIPFESGIQNPFTFTGREFDPETGNYYYRARYYNPGTGRFISEDPIGFDGGDENLFRYVENNPTNEVDPSGTLSKGDIRRIALQVAKKVVLGVTGLTAVAALTDTLGGKNLNSGERQEILLLVEKLIRDRDERIFGNKNACVEVTFR